jgi:Zn-dependent protease with chaperone function
LSGLVAYLAVGTIGVTLIWFMLRPLLTAKSALLPQRSIARESEPVFFQFVEQICALIKTPPPTRIVVDWQPNASASLVHGFRGLFLRELTLTIGLPLATKLTVAEFGGVLAHELGHFAQGTGMRLSYLIRKLNSWLSRVAFQPNVIEQRLSRGPRRVAIYGRITLLGAQMAIWLTRRILHGLLLVGHAMSCYSLRQMEYGADCYETKISGVQSVGSALHWMRHLQDGFQRAMILLNRGLARQRCADNFIALIEARADMAAQNEAWNLGPTSSPRSRWFDTHPGDSVRIARATQFREPPALVDSRPARFLFADFEELSRSVTNDFYGRIGMPMAKLARVDLAEFCSGEALNPSQNDDVIRFFANRAHYCRPLPLNSSDLTSRADQLPDEVAKLREEWIALREETEPAFVRFLEARRRRFELVRERVLRDARAGFSLARFSLSRRSRSQIEAELKAIARMRAEAEDALAYFDQLTARRLIRLICASERTSEELKRAVEAIEHLQAVWKRMPPLEEKLLGLAELLGNLRIRSPRSPVSRQALKMASELQKDLAELKTDLAIEDPLESKFTIADIVAQRIPAEKLRFEQSVAIETRECLGYLHVLYFQLLARLCASAAEAEKNVRTAESLLT